MWMKLKINLLRDINQAMKWKYFLSLEDTISLGSSIISDYYYLSTFSFTQIPEPLGEGSEKYPGLWL